MTDARAGASAAGGFILLMLVGAALAHAAMPHIFHAMPLNNMRVEIVLDALHRRDLRPEIAIFGNSVTASAIHDTTVSSELPGRPLIYNLATQAQSMGEAYLVYQDLPPSISLVVQQVSPWEFVEEEPFGKNKFNAYYSFGYRPTDHTISVLGAVFGEPTADLMRSSDTAETFRSRWVVSRLFDVAFWLHLKSTLYLDSLGRDVFFFANINRRANDDLFGVLVRHWQSILSTPSATAFERKRALLKIAIDDVRRSGRRPICWVPPIHPDLRRKTDGKAWDWFEQMLAEARAQGAGVVDLRAIEEDDGFRDAMHLKLDATERVSRAFARELVAAGFWTAAMAPAT